jgi:hypothetical protein
MTLDNALRDWAEWSNTQNHRLWYPQKSVGFATGGINCWDDLENQVDSYICNAVDTAIHDLQPIERAAIYTKYIHAVYRFPRQNFEQIIENAEQNLLKALDKKGVALDG